MADLPVERAIPDLRAALAAGGTAVLQAEPGAGKSTIVPLRLVDDDWLAGARIVMLEPRRLAARATARRMADLLGEEIGGTVGYRTRDDRRVGPRTRVEVVTEGILTRRVQRDPSLEGTGLVIFDEIHERNLQSDLALALCLDVRRSLRPDLGLLAMSATLDTVRVAELLGGDPGRPAPVISSPGRTHPVELRWRPSDPRSRLGDAVAAVVRDTLRHEDGDVLVFLPGAAEIRWTQSALTGGLPGDVDVRPLLGALSVADQDAALAPSPPGRRRVVLATDIAETSLTVAGVRVVVDTGLVRRPHYEGRSGLNRLVTTAASRASADQRAGRAGRTAPGVAYRMWSEAEHAARPPFAVPEILDTDLSGLALELAVWGAGASDLPFLDQPPPRRLDEAATLLRRLGAIDAAGRPTERGRAMSGLPLHPRLARIVLEGSERGAGPTACVLAALLDEGSSRSATARQEVDLEAVVTVYDDRDRRARDIARRAGIGRGPVDPSQVGHLVSVGYPDRIAGSRGGGRFRLRSGRGIALDATDPLAGAPFLVVADLGPGARGADDDRVRMAAALDLADVEAVAGDDIDEVHTLAWNDDRDDLEDRTERRLDAVVLASRTGRPSAGPATAAALAQRVADGHLDLIGWSTAARALQHRAGFARTGLGGSWPDVSDDALVATVGDWLEPRLAGAVGRSDLARVEMAGVLRRLLGHRAVADLDRTVPTSFTAPSGRSVPIDYAGEQPSLSIRVQELFGSTTHPSVAEGRIPIVVHLLSPAGHDVQVTADLPGFWAGSWSEVRKEMAGRYPKHDWPVDPTAATARTRPSRRR